MLTRQANRAIHGPEGRRGEEVDVVAEQRVVSVAARDHGVADIADLQAADRLDPLLAAAAHIDLDSHSQLLIRASLIQAAALAASPPDRRRPAPLP
jgi:hypothetical protein